MGAAGELWRGHRRLRGRRRATSSPAWPDEPGWLVPILVDYFGRDGSTLMMRLLASSPGIAVERPYPYERRYLTYLWAWAHLLDREEWPRRWSVQKLASLAREDRTALVGPPPWLERELISAAPGGVEMSRRCFELIWGEFSKRATRATRAAHGKPDAEVRYYAEKHLESWRADLSVLPAHRLIVVLRDPRDTFASMLAFDRARGGKGGFRAAEGPERVQRMLEQQRGRLRWIAALDTDEGVVVRYEEMVLELEAVATRLGEWLGVELDPRAVLDDRRMRRQHVTASSPAASIGRWRAELEPDVVAVFEASLGPELQALGFDRR